MKHSRRGSEHACRAFAVTGHANATGFHVGVGAAVVGELIFERMNSTVNLINRASEFGEFERFALNNSPLKREGFDQIRTLLACGCPQTCRHSDHETLFDAVLVRSRVLRRAAGIA